MHFTDTLTNELRQEKIHLILPVSYYNRSYFDHVKVHAFYES